MANVFDVAQYIRNKFDKISTIKLQKLVYYSKAWSLVWDEDPLFSESVEFWANGPVVPALYQTHKGQFFSPECFPNANPDNLTTTEKENIDLVIDSYGKKSPQYLVALSHTEAPWRDSWGDIPDGERCSNSISDNSIAEYYCNL